MFKNCLTNNKDKISMETFLNFVFWVCPGGV